MNHISKKLIILSVFLSGINISAQSILSLNYPFGQPISPNTGITKSFGGAGVALKNDYSIMALNPANLGTIDKTLFSSLASGDFLNLYDHELKSNFFTFVPQLISFAIPFGQAGTLGFSIEKRSNAQAFLSTHVEPSSSDVLAGITSADLQLLRSGGTTAWQIGWGSAIRKLVYLGLSYERLYSVVDSIRYTVIRTPTKDYNSFDSTTMVWRGNGLRLGAIVPFKKFNIGISGEYFFTSPLELTAGVYHQNSTTPVFEQTISGDSLRLPPVLRIGTSLMPNPSWTGVADLSMTLWKYYRNRRVSATNEDPTLSVNGGVQYIPAPNLLVPRYWEIMQYRLGGRYSQLTPDMAEAAIVLGTGFPLKRGGLLDIIVEYGRRFDERYTDFTEEFIYFGLGINGGHKWIKSSEGNY